MSDPALEREAIALFEAMFDIPGDEREAWIEERTRGRADLGKRLLAMLKAEQRLTLQTGGATAFIEEESQPERIGAYRIAGRIGRGGMGSVYRGERDTGDFAHTVAIKLIKPGLLSSALVERFERERQTLAGFTHPNIAQLYDGGQTDDGSPFIVMELVDGVPLLDWADRTGASLAQRLAVFRQICAGVAFAHGNLVVHRDLTPSNVLVTPDGTAKLIDFGIAKPADPAGAAEDIHTSGSLESLSLTPGYAAPERRFSRAVTTSADVFSLGKLLETLVEGLGDAELAVIAGKAAAAEPGDRYPTVDALADDLTAWQQRLPVAAVAGGRRYTARKFYQRNRRGVLLACGAAALLLAAFAATTWSWFRAEEARAAEAQRFGQVRSLARYLLFDLNERLSNVPGNVGARADLAAKAQGYLDILAASKGTPDDLRLETAQGLVRLGQIQGVPIEPNLGEVNRASANLDRAKAILVSLPPSPARDIELARADIYGGLIQMHGHSLQDEAARRFDAAEKRLVAMPQEQRGEDWHLARRSQRMAMLELADVGDTRDRIPAISAAMVADRRAWPKTLLASDLATRDDAVVAYYEALRLSFDDFETATRLFLANEKRFDALLAAKPYDAYLLYYSAWNNFDGFAAASSLGREDQSDRLIRKAGSLVDRLMAIDPLDDSAVALSGNVREGLSQNLRDAGRFDEAIALQQRVVAQRRSGLTPKRKARSLGNTAFSLAILGIIARDAGKRTLACASYVEAEALFTEAAARGEILGFQQAMLAGLRKKKQACATGGSIEGVLR